MRARLHGCTNTSSTPGMTRASIGVVAAPEHEYHSYVQDDLAAVRTAHVCAHVVRAAPRVSDNGSCVAGAPVMLAAGVCSVHALRWHACAINVRGRL